MVDIKSLIVLLRKTLRIVWKKDY